VILSQIFRGFADEIRATRAQTIDGPGLASAIRRADVLAWASVGRPVEGTILSVSRAAARAGSRRAADRGATLHEVTSTVLEAARVALAATPSQLPALARAGVVDAGGAGYVLLLEALERVVTHDIQVEALLGEDPLRRRPGWSHPAPIHPGADLDPNGPAYEVMYLLDGASDEAVVTLRGVLGALGDSLLVIGDTNLRNVHVHVDDVGAAIEAGIAAGRPHRIRVTHFAHARGQLGHGRPDPDALAVVACAAGEGLAGVFRGAGAQVVLSGPKRRASAGQLLEAARATGAASVLVLPNDADTVLAANAAASVAREEGISVRVVAARTAVQGIAALAVFDPGAGLEANALSMASAAAATRNGAVTVATRDALTSAGWCHSGDVLGVVDGDVAVIGDDLQTVAGEVVDRLLASGGELLTVVTGEDAPAKLGEDVIAAARIRRRDLEVSQLYGGQPVYPLMIGVE
ncbi:MAG: DAK2 domain-containing protein, partial [Lapillicoccus sp.]